MLLTRTTQSRRPSTYWLLLVVLVACLAPPVTGSDQDAPDPLAEMGWTETRGAAPGYVDDVACDLCHDSIYASYQEVAMSRAFYRPSPEQVIEELDEPFHHEPSDRYYEMSLEGERYVFKRYQLDGTGQPINVLEQPVDWVLGSGRHSRTYLFRTQGGELFQLPLAWYTQTSSWGMAPGYDNPAHLGVQRRVRRECMFCHNAFPEVPEGSDTYSAPHVFPEDLPTGLGCQRCHGPGASHVRLALSDDYDPDELSGAIVNPGNLDPRLRDDVCYGCHMQPSVALIGIRRFGRPDYSFRPGQPLADYQVQIDVVEEGREHKERFEINHHPYRLEQSLCFTASEGRLGCLTCHDPHRKVPANEQPAWYRERCLGCHALVETAAHQEEDPGDCIPCHMPERRTDDVVRVTMTDHLIQRGPVDPEALAPREEREPILVDAQFLYPELAPPGPVAEIYRAATVVRAGGGANGDAVASLERLVSQTSPPEVEPWLDLAMGQLTQHRFEALDTTVAAILEREPGSPRALEWLGLARARSGRTSEAIDLLSRAAAAPITRPEAHYNLAVLLAQAGRFEEALESADRALAMRPNQSAAAYYRAKVLNALERPQAAAAAYRRALEIEPGLTRAYIGLGELLLSMGEREAALRYLEHGSRVARDPGQVAEALAEIAVAR